MWVSEAGWELLVRLGKGEFRVNPLEFVFKIKIVIF